MNKKLLSVIFFCFLSAIFFIAGKTYASDQKIIIGFNKNISEFEVAQQFDLNIASVKRIADTNNFRLNTEKFLGGVNTNPHIRFIEQDHIYSAIFTPNDTFYSEQWGSTRIDLPDAWDTTTGSAEILVAVLDTGINALHEDLSDRIISGYNFVNYTPITSNTDSDNNGHGTQVTGVVAAIGNNSKGVSGVNWLSDIMPVKVLNQHGDGYSSDIAAGIYYAVDQGVNIINLSLGGQYPSTAIKDAIDYAVANNAIVVAATGNEGSSISYPAKYTDVIAVGAIDDDDLRASFSNFGPEIDLIAPGVSIATTKDSALYNEYVLSSGTSFAAPYVSGVLSLVWSRYQGLSADVVESFVTSSAQKVSAMGGSDFSNEYGWGLINAKDALDPPIDTNPAHYHYQWISQNVNPSLDPNEAYQFSVLVKNTGSAIWKKNHVNLGTSNPRDRISQFLREGGDPIGWISTNRIAFDEDIVAPGEYAHYNFWMKAPSNLTGDLKEYFRLVADGITWMEDYGIHWIVHINSVADQYHYSISQQNPNPDVLMAGQSYNFEIKLLNSGSIAWEKNIVRLGTSNTQDRIPIFFRQDLVGGNPSGWLNNNRIQMQENVVAPGEIGTFSFWMTIPGNISSGSYKEYFRLVADGITWMENYNIYWQLDISRPHSQWVGQSDYPQVHQGEQTTLWVDFRNTGTSAWIKNTYYPIRLGTSNPLDRSSIFADESWISQNRINLSDESVASGEIGRFNFDITIPIDTPPGNYREYFRPVSDGYMWLEDNGVYWDIEVLPAEPI